MHRPAVLAPLLAAPLFAALLLAGCESTNPAQSNPSEKPAPSPLPYGYREPKGDAARPPPKTDGQEMDEIVAVVWGEVLTRRRLIRESGPRVEGQDEAAFERSLAMRRLRWAREQLFVKAAEFEGISIPAASLDEAVEERRQKEIETLSKNTGRPVTFDEYLKQQNMSEEEFRTSVKNSETTRALLFKHLTGLGRGTRPQVDWNVTPAEVRRMYREQPEEFDDPQKAAFVVYQLRYVDHAVGDVSPIEAEALTRKQAEDVAAAFRAGEAPEAIAKRFAFDERTWRAYPTPVEQLPPPLKPVADWVFAPERKPHESAVIEPPKMGGPLVLGILEVVPARKHTFEEAYDDVVERYRLGRRLRMESLMIIELVQGGSIAWPTDLANELVDQARETLKELDQDPVLSRARFR
jgi:hypothetical protein